MRSNFKLLCRNALGPLGNKRKANSNPTAESPANSFSFAGKVGEAGAGFAKRVRLGCTASKWPDQLTLALSSTWPRNLSSTPSHTDSDHISRQSTSLIWQWNAFSLPKLASWELEGESAFCRDRPAPEESRARPSSGSSQLLHQLTLCPVTSHSLDWGEWKHSFVLHVIS